MNVPSVSRQHARLRVTADSCTLSDAGSSFGTQVNGAPLKGEATLKAGDVFHCGAVAFTVEESVPASSVLTDDHQLLEDSASIMLRIGDSGVNPKAVPTGVPAGSGAAAAARPRSPDSERRKLSDRGRIVPFSGRPPHRRTGATSFLRLLVRSPRPGRRPAAAQVLSRVSTCFEVVPAERTFFSLRDSGRRSVTARVPRAREADPKPRSPHHRDEGLRERVRELVRRGPLRLVPAPPAASMRWSTSVVHVAPLWTATNDRVLLHRQPSRSASRRDLDVSPRWPITRPRPEQARIRRAFADETQKREACRLPLSPAVVTDPGHAQSSTRRSRRRNAT